MSAASGVPLKPPSSIGASGAELPLEPAQQAAADGANEAANEVFADDQGGESCMVRTKSLANRVKDKCNCTPLNIIIALVAAAAAVLLSYFLGGITDPALLAGFGAGAFVGSMALGAMAKCCWLKCQSLRNNKGSVVDGGSE